ncbi:antitoxin (DNA-binding transcriptional repressor) of toxin-antitoxin stability system [Caballeronia udeis]|jgi:antitoxin (DNA-binding transcriptional repressor) of toxin-antitoxin stability system|uniref:Antitoxin (DNA-binding transcriptional repressor) of toxin-antitoxin stability system n=1 Tax=Caballeronia udeis TaxID=1232866 RepID=A0ABW8MNR1_9BURK
MPNRQVSKSEFKAKALEFFRQVESSGESLIVTDHGRPTLELRPYRADARDPLDLLRGSLLRYDNPTDPVGEDDWEAAR